MVKREAAREFEVVSLDGRDLITLIINDVAYDMSIDVAKMLASDIRKGIVRAVGK